MISIPDEKTFNVLKYDLSRLLPLRIVLRKDEDGKLKGLCEDSFSMSLSEHNVRIWWSGRAYSILGEHLINGIEDAEHNAKKGDLILDPLSEDCPIEVNWERWRAATTKYSQRNALFKVKEVLE
jgi:hypothetical protein